MPVDCTLYEALEVGSLEREGTEGKARNPGEQSEPIRALISLPTSACLPGRAVGLGARSFWDLTQPTLCPAAGPA